MLINTSWTIKVNIWHMVDHIYSTTITHSNNLCSFPICLKNIGFQQCDKEWGQSFYQVILQHCSMTADYGFLQIKTKIKSF